MAERLRVALRGQVEQQARQVEPQAEPQGQLPAVRLAGQGGREYPGFAYSARRKEACAGYTYVEEVLDRALRVVKACTQSTHDLFPLESHPDQVLEC